MPPDIHAGFATSTFCAPKIDRTRLLQDQADAPGREQRLQRASVEAADHAALERHPDGRGDHERDRQRRDQVPVECAGK